MSALCEKCGGDTAIIKSIKRGNPSRVRRRRECVDPDCGHRHTTYEISRSEKEIYDTVTTAAKEIRDAVIAFSDIKA